MFVKGQDLLYEGDLNTILVQYLNRDMNSMFEWPGIKRNLILSVLHLDEVGSQKQLYAGVLKC